MKTLKACNSTLKRIEYHLYQDVLEERFASDHQWTKLWWRTLKLNQLLPLVQRGPWGFGSLFGLKPKSKCRVKYYSHLLEDTIRVTATFDGKRLSVGCVDFGPKESAYILDAVRAL